MNQERRQYYIDNLIDNLPVLRKKLKLNQKDLAQIIGVSTYTLLAIEKRQRKMTWNTFLSLLLVFLKNEDTMEMLPIFNIWTNELMEFIGGNTKGV